MWNAAYDEGLATGLEHAIAILENEGQFSSLTGRKN
jgi:hypothetical protein